MSIDISIQCDWCRGFCDPSEVIACEKCYNELVSERDALLEEVATLQNAAMESSR